MHPRDRRSTLLARLGFGAFLAATECLLYWLVIVWVNFHRRRLRARRLCMATDGLVLGHSEIREESGIYDYGIRDPSLCSG
jgi:hypothetical protein